MTEILYRRPTWVRTKLVNPFLRSLVLRAGLGRRGEQNLMRVLRVQGRRSGRTYEIPVRIALWEGGRYVVSLLGDAQWARNLRAAGTAQLLVGSTIDTVVAHEILGAEKTAFLRWYCREPSHRLSVRTGLKVDPAHLSSADIDRVVHQHPIFRLDPAVPPASASRSPATD